MWGDIPIEGYDCGMAVGDWLCKVLQKPRGSFKLLYYTPGLYNERTLDSYRKRSPIMENKKDLVMFPDVTTYHLITQASMDDLNSKLDANSKQLDERNFRPNFLILGNRPAFDEVMNE